MNMRVSMFSTPIPRTTSFASSNDSQTRSMHARPTEPVSQSVHIPFDPFITNQLMDRVIKRAQKQYDANGTTLFNRIKDTQSQIAQEQDPATRKALEEKLENWQWDIRLLVTDTFADHIDDHLRKQGHLVRGTRTHQQHLNYINLANQASHQAPDKFVFTQTIIQRIAAMNN